MVAEVLTIFIHQSGSKKRKKYKQVNSTNSIVLPFFVCLFVCYSVRMLFLLLLQRTGKPITFGNVGVIYTTLFYKNIW